MGTIPEIALIVVLLPDPFEPRRVTICLLLTVREIPFNAWMPPYQT
jgi:hypothetical protein